MSLNIIIDADVASASSKISKFSYEVKETFGSIQTTLNKTADGFKYSTDNIKNSVANLSKDSRIALTNLSLVLQDLPYGFIGIQNNLPFLAKSFTDIAAKTTGAAATLKALGAELIGPAGLFLAFSAVTSVVTYAVKEYGSLENAIKAVTSSSQTLFKIQLQLNKALASAQGETAGEISKIKILTSTLNNLKLPQDQRYAAYVELKKIAPDIAAGIKDENALSEKSIEIINKNSEARLAYLQLRAREISITGQLNKNETDRLLLEQEYPNLLAKKTQAEILNNKTKKEGYDATKNFSGIVSAEQINLQSATDALNENAKKRRELNQSNDSLFNQLKDLLPGISQYDANTKNLTDSLQKQNEAESKRLSNLDKYNKKLQELKYRLYFSLKENPLITEDSKKRIEDASKAFKEFNLDVLDKKAKGPGKLLPNYSLEVQQIISENDLFKKKFLETRIFLENSVFRPLEDVFEIFFEKGTSGFKEMGKIIMQQIRKLAAQIIASGIVTLIASLINPIGAVAAGGPKALDLFSILGNAAKNVLGGQVGRPRFAGVNQGGLNFSGNVAMVLRGQDLVGALNRTNLQIERLG